MPYDLAYDAVLVSLRPICDDAVVHLDQIEHRGLPVLLADYRDGMAFLAQLDSSLSWFHTCPYPSLFSYRLRKLFLHENCLDAQYPCRLIQSGTSSQSASFSQSNTVFDLSRRALRNGSISSLSQTYSEPILKLGGNHSADVRMAALIEDSGLPKNLATSAT